MSKPIKSYRYGGIEISIWQGEKGNSFSIRKSYKDQNGQWLESKYFYEKDLLSLRAICDSIITKKIQASASSPVSDTPAYDNVKQQFQGTPVSNDSSIPF